MTVRVLLADDQALIRGAFRMLVDSDPELQVVGEAADGDEAVELAAAERPDVVLMDIRMNRVDGLTAMGRIFADERLAEVKVIILTTFGQDEYLFEALRLGASGFLVKDTDPADLLRAIKVVARGESLLSPSITRRVISEFVRKAVVRPTPPARLDDLTEREREVLTLVGGGLSNEEIAKQLVVSPATAKTHVSRTMTKLRVRDRAQLVVIAYEAGLVTPGWLS